MSIRDVPIAGGGVTGTRCRESAVWTFGGVTRAVVAALALSAVGTLPVMAQAKPDRSKRPAISEAPDVKLPPLQQFTLANGMKVLLMEKRDIPLVQVTIVVNAGSVLDEHSNLGISSLTAAMLDEGAAGKSALDIADAFEAIGARFSISPGTHAVSLSLRATSQRMPEALKIASDVVLRPDFPEQELDRLRKERLTGLVRRYDDPNSIASELFDATLYGSLHPYGRSASGTDMTLRSLRATDLRQFYTAHYRPNNSTAIVVGDIDPAAARALLEGAFGQWQRGAAAAPAVAVPAQVKGRVIYVVDKPGAAQSVVRFGRIGVARTTKDYFALEVMNTILGGSFTSRLNQNLREKKGYSYGAGSAFDYYPSTGSWSADASVQTQSTGPALAEFMNELRGMLAPIPVDEVERARSNLAMSYPAAFQSVSGIASQLSDMLQNNLAPDFFNRYVDNVLAVTPADVMRVAREYIDPENVTIFVVGDRKVIEQQIREQNLGEIRFMAVTDVLGPMPVLDK